VLNEAIEIAKKYGSLDSSSFVNGVLHHISMRRPEGSDRRRAADATAPADAEDDAAERADAQRDPT